MGGLKSLSADANSSSRYQCSDTLFIGKVVPPSGH